jgi:hypothetical protein
MQAKEGAIQHHHMGASGASAGPGYPLQFLSPLRGSAVFPLLSLARSQGEVWGFTPNFKNKTTLAFWSPYAGYVAFRRAMRFCAGERQIHIFFAVWILE